MASRKKKYGFIIMDMRGKDPMLTDTLNTIKRVCKKLSITAERVDELGHTDQITRKIVNSIAKSDIIIADLTHQRQNVYYELGYCHGINKRVVLIARKRTKLHFNVKDYNVLFYENVTELEEKLKAVLSEICHRESPAKDSYSYLNGKWYECHITRDANISSEPIWLRGECHLKIKEDHSVEGLHKVTHHPISPLEYKVEGYIRDGRMVLTERCITDLSEFFIAMYPNLLSRNMLVGTWIGFDWQHRCVTASIILCREEMNRDELNKLLLKSKEVSYIFKGEKIDKLLG